MITVVGIDPGLAATGIGILRGVGENVSGYSYGVIKTSQRASEPMRLEHIYTKLTDVLQKNMPDLMVVEDIFSLKRYPKSGILLGKVSGVTLLAGYRQGITIAEIPVREAKHVLTGNGNATKVQLEKAVRHFLNHPTEICPNHASDALALAIIGLLRHCGPLSGKIKITTR